MQIQVHTSFNSAEMKKIDEKVSELGLTRYLFLRKCALESAGLIWNGKQPNKKTHKSGDFRVSNIGIERATETDSRENVEVARDDLEEPAE